MVSLCNSDFTSRHAKNDAQKKTSTAALIKMFLPAVGRNILISAAVLVFFWASFLAWRDVKSELHKLTMQIEQLHVELQQAKEITGWRALEADFNRLNTEEWAAALVVL